MTHTEAVNALRHYVSCYFDGSIETCFRLDELLWEVRIHNQPTVLAEPADDSEVVIDLEELGL